MIEYVQVFRLLKLMLISGMLTQDALAIFLAGVEAVKPSRFIPQHIQLKGEILNIASHSIQLSQTNGLYIAAIGKAAAAMALETEKIVGDHITSGIVVTKYHHGTTLSYCRTIEAGHPVPDKNSIEGGKAVIELFKQAGKEDTIIMLISGGASALLADFPPGCTLEDLQQTVQLLLDCGAPIDEVNTIRKHLSQIKGGKLIQYTAARVFALVLSDVPGDDLSVIASGLTVADDSSFDDCKEIIERYHLSEKLPTAVSSWLHKGIQKEIPDTPKRGNPIFEKVFNTIVASNATALKAATTKSHLLGYTTIILSPDLSGEAAEQAVYFVKELKQRINKKPLCLLWGGETTVTIKGKGKGGRNQEFALAALNAFSHDEELLKHAFVILSAGTDGTDGPTDAAGAIVNAETVFTAEKLSLNASSYLNDNNAYSFFEQTKGLIITGPTQTNVMDIVVGITAATE